jgi:uncharacterized protein YjbI with pentapeptide repeats
MRRWLVFVGVAALAVGLVALVAWDLVIALNLPDGRDRFRGELLGLLVPLAAAIAGAGALLNFVNSRAGLKETQQQNRDQLELNRRGQLTERFSKAIDQLGADETKLDVRLGAIYALEQIARDSLELHWPVLQVLTAYLRRHAADRGRHQRTAADVPTTDDSGQDSLDPGLDFLAVADVIRRRRFEWDLEQLDLSGADIRGARFEAAQLTRALFTGARVQEADFSRAQLHGAIFIGAQVDRAFFEEAHLEAATFVDARLNWARFSRALLKGADFRGAQLKGARFDGAQFDRADFHSALLEGADFGSALLEGADFDSAVLKGASFDGAQLKGASFVGAQLEGASFVGAQLEGAKGVTEQMVVESGYREIQ